MLPKNYEVPKNERKSMSTRICIAPGLCEKQYLPRLQSWRHLLLQTGTKCQPGLCCHYTVKGTRSREVTTPAANVTKSSRAHLDASLHLHEAAALLSAGTWGGHGGTALAPISKGSTAYSFYLHILLECYGNMNSK